MNIVTEQQYGEWFAFDTDTYDGPGSYVGCATSERAAINDLVEQVIDRLEDRVDELLEQVDELQADKIALEDRFALVAPETSRQEPRGDLGNEKEYQDSGPNPKAGLLEGWGPWDRGQED